jgi:hypothetical protein
MDMVGLCKQAMCVILSVGLDEQFRPVTVAK